MCPPTDPTDPATPADTNFAKVAAEHLRDLKTYIQTQVARIAALENAAQVGTGRVYGLKTSNYEVNPFTALTNISAKCIVARNAAGGTKVLNDVTGLQIDLAVGPGPVVNGRDQAGNFVVNDEIHIFAIFDTNGANPKLIASTSATLPALPTGYVYWCYLFSAVCADTNKFCAGFLVAGNRVRHATTQMYSGALSTTIYKNDKTDLKIPSVAVKKFFDFTSASDNGLASFGILDCDGAGGTFVGDQAFGAVPSEGLTLMGELGNIELMKLSTHTGLGSGGIDSIAMSVCGYTVPNGDV